MKQPKSPNAPPMKKRRAAVILSLASAAALVLTLLGAWCLRHYLADPTLLREYIGDHYFSGALILIAIAAVQVVLAFIPGELIEIASGYAFGMWGGAFICWAGIMLGSVVTLLLVKKFGRPFVEVFQSAKKLESISLLSDKKRRGALTFLLFLIPGIPKDFWTYIVGLTDMKLRDYIILTGIARFPSIIMSTAGGDAIGLGKLGNAAWIMVGTGIVSAIGYLIYLAIDKKRAANAVSSADRNDKEDI
ncbi:MAG: TVP38/TMEM64 family protein [Clostridia bacterium]|nr:TVP38/TMEM64 family protein [Clostridia bacterium]